MSTEQPVSEEIIPAPESPKGPAIPVSPPISLPPALPGLKDPRNLANRPSWDNRFGVELNINATEAHAFYKKYFGKGCNETPYSRYRQMHLESTAAVSLAKKMMLEGSNMADIQEALTKRGLAKPTIVNCIRTRAQRYSSVAPPAREVLSTSTNNNSQASPKPGAVREMRFLIPKQRHIITERGISIESFRQNLMFDRHRDQARHLFTKPVSKSALGSYQGVMMPRRL